MKSATLFGGALFAAGIVSAPAAAQSFDFTYHYGYLSAYTFFSGAYASNAPPSSGFFDIEATSLPGTTATAFAYASLLGTGAESPTDGTAESSIVSRFTVSDAARGVSTWDWTGGTTGRGYLAIYDKTNAATILEVDAANGGAVFGVFLFDLVPGVEYEWVSSCKASVGIDGMSFALLYLTPPPCVADCDGNGALNVDDVDCFVAGFIGGDLGTADCDGNGTLNVDDVDCFVTAFIGGCP